MVSPMSPNVRSAMFAPLDQNGRVETVIARLVDAITLGLLVDAEQLPSETELAGQFGVATVTVREALMALRQQGLIETRRGRGGGSFVRAPVNSARTWHDRLAAVSLTDLRDLGDHYAAVAGTAARLAADRASPDDVARLELAAADLRSASDTAVARAERLFHLEIAAAAQSPRLTNAEAQLQGEFGGLLWLPIGHGGGPGAAQAHAAITAAVAANDGERARAATEKHIFDTVDRLTDLRLSL